MVGYRSFAITALALFLMLGFSFAETTCTVSGCDITITIKIAFSGADQAYMNRAENEIENVWNGPGGFRTVGDCKCKLTFDVITAKTADCKNNPPAGYHCISVTNFFKPDGAYNDPPRNQTNITGAQIYVGYMYGIAKGNGNNSQQGWWSDQMSRPINASNPAGGSYEDFAHEAGHMMGLNHTANTSSVMNNTVNGNPTQDDLENIANEICGANPCPDRCCCGDGVVEKGKGEDCDPKASPSGCSGGQSCCPVCCGCYGPLCIAASGEYLTLATCQASCGPGASCYMNYKTGCWDCVKQIIVVTGTCRDPSVIRGNMSCDHMVRSVWDQKPDLSEVNLSDVPFAGGLFASERVDVFVEGDDGHVVTQDGMVVGFGHGLLEDPTMKIYTDKETIALLAGQEMSPEQALFFGKVRIEGADFFGSLRIGFYKFLFDVYSFFDPPPEYAPLEDEVIPA